jgi:uncharacterized protein YhbP (UPF0306 family)
MDVEKTIREYLADIIHLSLATAVDNKPWVCEVHFVFDNDLNLYYRSRESRRHSQEIAKNPFVAGNIVEQHGLDTQPRGVYFEGKAEIIEDFSQDQPAYKQFIDRMGATPDIVEEADQDGGHKVYKVTVSDYYLFDSRESSPSQKYHLPWGSKGNT